MAGYDQSLLYHSVRFYTGQYTYRNVPYRIGNNETTVQDETEIYYDTWDSFHLIPTERPDVPVPKANTKFVNIPGRSAPIDMTTFLTGHPTFANRTGSWSFYTDVDYVNRNLGGWIAFDKQLQNLFHGRISKIALRDDPGYFYAGQLTKAPWQTGESYSTISISFNLYPYKKSNTSSMELWKFDDFDFQNGVIMYLKDMSVNGSRTVNIYGGRERISPHIHGTGGLYVDKLVGNNWVSYGSVPTASITSQASIVPELVIDEGTNQLRFRGNGAVTIDYRRGLL